MDYLLYTVGVVLLMFACLQLGIKNKAELNYFTALSYAVSGSILVYEWAVRVKLIYVLYPLYDMVVVQAFVFAPTLYTMFCHITGLVRLKPALLIRTYIPAAVVFIFILGNNFINSSVIRSGSVSRDIRSYPTFFTTHVLNILADAYILFFLILMLRQGALLLQSDDGNETGEVRHLLIFIRVFIVAVVLMIVAGIIRNEGLLGMTRVASGLIFVVFIFYGLRNPEFTQGVIRRAPMIGYKCSRLHGLDTEGVLARMKFLMETRKAFTDADLSLCSLSARLLVTPHQLSEIINEHLGMNFCTFLNGYRIREAERLLVENRELSILTIAFEAGFNSKASFNAHFLRRTGLTPSGYRAKYSSGRAAK